MQRYYKNIITIICLIIGSVTVGLQADCDDTRCGISDCVSASKTTFRPRPITQDVIYFLALNQYRYYNEYFHECSEEQPNFYITLGALYQKSRHRNCIGNYFFPGSQDSSTEPVDSTAVTSVFRLSPERKVIGGYLEYHQDFCWCDTAFWFELKTAFYKATHCLGISETVVSEPTIGNQTITPLCYLSSNAFTYGRLYSGEADRFGIDDVLLKLGTTLLDCPGSGYLGLYASAVFPSSPRPKACVLFEPIIGAGHFGAGFGVNGGYDFDACDDTTLALLFDLSYQYLFKREEFRSFDLNQGPVNNRFMAASLPNNVFDAVPAINFTTICVDVTPRTVLNFWVALHYHYCDFSAEFGYNLWWRQAEKICLKNCPQNEDLSGNGRGIIVDGVFVPLTLTNLNLASASHTPVLTNKIYGALGYDTCICDTLIGFTVGGSFELSHRINALEQWGVWGGITVGF